MKSFIVFFILFACQSLTAQEVINLWTGQAPYSKPNSLEETVIESWGVQCAKNVTNPTLSVYRAKGKNSGRAMIILPGGGYELESIVAEGRLIAEYLSNEGIVAVVLKYRLPLEEASEKPHLLPITDARKAIALLRSMAGNYGFDPGQVGIMGFSAGGHLATAVSVLRSEKQDENPDFSGLIYPVTTLGAENQKWLEKSLFHRKMTNKEKKQYELVDNVTKLTPPAFLLHAYDDEVVPIEESLLYAKALRAAGQDVEEHYFAKGGHGFGPGRAGDGTSQWLGLLANWIKRQSPTTGQNSIELDRGWVMRTGDNQAWAKPDFDDGKWRAIEVGKPWEKAGYANYDGYAWYRIEFTVPERWQEQDENGLLSLSLGSIDDADVTYFNGERVGATGSVPPDYKTAYYTRRFYRVPTSLVRWGEANVIAVRVYDDHNDGGLYQGPYTLRLPQFEDLIGIKFNFENSNGIYLSDDSPCVTINIKNHSYTDYELDAVFELVNDRVDSVRVLESIKKTVHIDGKGEVSKTIKFARRQPGFYHVVCTLNDSMKKTIILGYEPEKIVSPITREVDFSAFWKQRKRELAGVAPRFKVTKNDRSTDRVDVYLVEMQSYGNVKVRGWYTVPKKPGPHPAILSVPGYTSTMWPYVNRTNVATFALNPRGHGNSKDDVDPKGEEYMFIGFDPERPEKYIYAGAYLDCLRAVDFLVSRPEIDSSRIGVEGGSQGGGLSFATAALDNRIIFCAPDIPWLGDWVGYLETAEWAHDNYPKLIKEYPDLTFAGVNRLLSYFDTMNMAEWITCPVLMSVGLQDDVCPPRTSFAPYNAVKSKKEYRVYPFAGHGVWREHGKLKDEWMAQMFGIDKIGDN